MIRARYVWLFVGVVLSTHIGCKKEIDQFVPVQEAVDFDFSSEFSDIRDTLGYKIEGDDWNIVYTPKGTAFILKPGMFEFTDGSSCSCETVNVQIIEVAEKRDLLLHNTPTVSDNALLATAGAYHISAAFQGRQLQLIDYEQICFVLPSKKLEEGMELFYGSQSRNRFSWTPASVISGSQSYVKKGEWLIDSSWIVGYECFSDNMDWLGVHKFISDGTENQTCVKLNEFFTEDNTVIFAIFNDQKAMVRLDYEANKGFCTQNLPEGSSVRFVGIAKRDDTIYDLANETARINADHLQTLSFMPVPLSDLKSFLLAL
ncbi:MAG: hypothetical protein HKN87_07830 [Saprospiraceae bacterium]|nr:hypothetical protein [Saprospiraceae bacterium]